MLMTAPFFVETTWPQPTPQKGQTVVVGVAPAVLSGGIAGAHPACDRAPIASVPVVNPPRNWRRVGPGGWPGVPSAPCSRFTWSSSFILPSTSLAGDRSIRLGGLRVVIPAEHPSGNVATNSVTSAVMTRMPARFSQKPAFIICGIRTSPVPNTIAFGGVPTGIM